MTGVFRFLLTVLAVAWTSSALALSITKMQFASRHPWQKYVDIDVWFADVPANGASVTIAATDGASGRALPVRTIWRDGDETKSPKLTAKNDFNRYVWDVGRDVTNLVSSQVTIEVQAVSGAGRYLVVDLAHDGAVSYLPDMPQGGWPDEYKTDKLVLRQVQAPAGKAVTVGSPEDEIGRLDNEALRTLTLDENYYIGVFPVTQRQFAHVAGYEPSWHSGDCEPVEGVSYRDACDDFIRVLNALTEQPFGLPTEAQWEYACRAGTTTAYSNGKDLPSESFLEEWPELGDYACYVANCPYDDWGWPCTSVVGLRKANEWGLFDMHGNVWEWCRGDSDAEVVARGGSCTSWAADCRSASRNTDYGPYDSDDTTGFRVACAAPAESGASGSAKMTLKGTVDVLPLPFYQSASSTISIRCNAAWVGASTYTVTCDGTEQTLGTYGLTWPQGTLSDGRHVLALKGKENGRALSAVGYLVPAGVKVISESTVAASTTWSGDAKTVVVAFPVTVKSGVTLTIPPESVVKFAEGASLTVEPGATCVAAGVIFTHVNDDTVGTRIVTEEGAVPRDGRYQISGAIADDDKTEYRYLGAHGLTSGIEADTVLRSGATYVIASDLAVAESATLTLKPGAIVKFAPGAGLDVAGRLVAEGTLAEPVVFTSLADDAHGGDTNGDGAQTLPASGDWRGLSLAGGATLSHCQLLYGSDRTDVGVVHETAGEVTLESCEIAHAKFECVRVNGGKLTARNSVFRDASTAFGYFGGEGVDVVNCVVADCQIASRGPNKHFENTVFYRCLSFLFQPGSTDCRYCLFFNPEGYGEQTTPAVSDAQKCRWGDPLFKDAANGDYTPATAESPCVDAAFGPDAPRADAFGNARTNVTAVTAKYGQPDADGNYPDLGAIEFLDEVGGAPADLAMTGFTAPASVRVGETMSLTYTVKNVGRKATGMWRDGIAFVSADGTLVVPTGEVRAAPEGGIEKDAFFTQTVTVTVPVLREGEWYVRVTANAGRELRENEFSNNARLAKNDTTVTLAASPLDAAATRTVACGSPVALKYVTDGEARVLEFVAPPGAVVRYGSGFMPSETAATGAVTVGPDGRAVISLPPNAVIYVVVSSDVAGTVIAESRAASLTVTGVTPNVILRREGGEALLTVTGFLFGEDSEVALTHGTMSVAARRVTFLSSERLVAEFDPSPSVFATTGEWTLSVRSGGAWTEAEGKVRVADEGGGWQSPELVCTAELPDSLRQGRAFDFTLAYRLADDAQTSLKAPIVTLRSPHLQFQTAHATYTNEVRLVALGASGSEGELMPGVTYRLRVTAAVRTDVELEKVWYDIDVLTASTAGATGALPAGEFLSAAKLATATGEERVMLEALRTRLGLTWAEFFERFGRFVTNQGSFGLADIDYAVMVHDFARRALSELKEAAFVPVRKISRVADGSPSTGAETKMPVVDWDETDVTNRSALRARTAANRVTLAGLAAKFRTPGNVWVYDKGGWYRLCSGSGESLTFSSHFNRDLANCVVLCHGALESLHSSWVNAAAAALAEAGDWPTGARQNVLAVDWGTWANADATPEESVAMEQRAAADTKTFAWMGAVTTDRRRRLGEAEYGFAPAMHVAAVAKTAYGQLGGAGISAGSLTLIGAGHGGHVAGAIAGLFAKSGAKVRRLVGLETSTTCAFAFVPAADKYPGAWSKDSATVTEFYKSTCWLSAGAHVGEGVDQVFGHFNFTVVPAKDRFGARAFFEGRSLRADNGASGGARGYLLNADSDSCEGRTNLFLSQDVARWFAATVRACGSDPEYGGWCGLGWSWMEKASPPKFALPYAPYVKDLRTDYAHGFHAVIRERDRAIDLIRPERLEPQ